MTPQRRSILAAGALIAAAGLGGGVAYAATSSSRSPGSHTGMSSSMMGGRARPGTSDLVEGMGRFNTPQPFDAQFIDQMSVHHEGAIGSTQAMIAHSTRPELRALAQNIISTQRAQLTQMSAWRAQWYPGMKPTFAMAGSMMGEGATGNTMMRSAAMMAGATMTGTDRMYLQMMIVHHQLAVDMANQARHRAAHPQLKVLAATIAREQSAQIIQMRAYLAAIPR